MAKKTKTKSRGNLYIIIIAIAVVLLLVYNHNNRNTNFDSTGIYISGAQNNKVSPNKKRDFESLPAALRWLNPFKDN